MLPPTSLTCLLCVWQLFAAWALANAAPFHSGPEDKARFDKMVIDHSALAVIDVEPHLKPVMQVRQ